MVLAAATLSGCEATTKERAVNPMFRGLEGSATRVESAPLPGSETLRSDPNLVTPTEIRVEVSKGKFVLRSRSARDLMRHIHATLEKNERDLFTTQVLSDRTRREFLSRGYDPGAAFDHVALRKEDVRRLFDRLPMGEHSPNALMQKVERRVYRVLVTGKASEGLRWVGFDMILEDREWRLLWFVGD